MHVKELMYQSRWLVWKDKNGKKMPINPNNPQQAGSSTDPSKWTTFAAAQKLAEKDSELGVGVALDNSGLTVIDLDHCLDRTRSTNHPVMMYIIEACRETYMEVSPGGDGLHIFLRGEMPDGKNILGGNAIEDKRAGLEAYDHGRYMTWTADIYENAPLQIMDGRDILDQLPELDRLMDAMKTVAAADPGEGNNVLNDEVFRFAGSTYLDKYIIEDAFVYAAMWNGRRSRGEALSTIKSAMGAGILPPPQSPPPGGTGGTGGTGGPNPVLQGVGQSPEAGLFMAYLSLGDQTIKKLRDSKNDWKWYIGGTWQIAYSEHVGTRMAEVVSPYAAQLATGGVGATRRFGATAVKHFSSLRVRNAAVKLLGANVAVRADIEDFDSIPYLLSCKNGVVDLRDGSIRDPRPEDMITKMVDVDYVPGSKCPTWIDALEMSLDPGLLPFMKQALGYSLTGSTSERCIFIAHGERGMNGKSTILDGFGQLLGDGRASGYSKTSSPDAVLQNDRSSTMSSALLAQLAGTRFVQLNETKSSNRLDETVVKQITGGDRVTAKDLYASPITFKPQFKVWLRTNAAPKVSTQEEAIWERIKLIPFEKQIPVERRRPIHEVWADFEREWEGMLAWAVEGAMEYYAAGTLSTPDIIADATEQYQKNEDVFKEFFDDMLIFDESLKQKDWAKLSDVLAEFVQWKNKFGYRIPPMSTIAFGKEFRRLRGQDATKRTKHGIKFAGCMLKKSTPSGADLAGMNGGDVVEVGTVLPGY